LHRVRRLPEESGQAALDQCLDLPQIGRLAREQGAVAQLRERVLIMRLEMVKDILVRAELEVLATSLSGLPRTRSCSASNILIVTCSVPPINFHP
jgi:hypothetical protein